MTKRHDPVYTGGDMPPQPPNRPLRSGKSGRMSYLKAARLTGPAGK